MRPTSLRRQTTECSKISDVAHFKKGIWSPSANIVFNRKTLVISGQLNIKLFIYLLLKTSKFNIHE